MDGKYEWRFCTECNLRIFKDEVEGDTIKTIDEKIYCIDCAVDILQQEIERLQRFKEYFDDLYGQGLEVANWHQNGELEGFDGFYESAIEYMD